MQFHFLRNGRKFLKKEKRSTRIYYNCKKAVKKQEKKKECEEGDKKEEEENANILSEEAKDLTEGYKAQYTIMKHPDRHKTMEYGREPHTSRKK